MRRFRYWLADLISGGELTRVNAEAQNWADKVYDNAIKYRAALDRIAAEVKPTSNATVKRMGRIASEALK